jgi:hypothetical protein
MKKLIRGTDRQFISPPENAFVPRNFKNVTVLANAEMKRLPVSGVSRHLHKYSAALCTFIAGVVSLVATSAHADEPNLNAPWPSSKKANAGSDSSTNQPAAPATNSNAAPASDATPTAAPNTAPPSSMYDATPVLITPKARKHEVSASGDFSLGEGTVSVPFGYSIAQTLPGAGVKKTVASAPRTSVYFGGTISYSYGQTWYVDFSYLQGRQTAPTGVSVPFTVNGPLRANFDINDDWYQVYARYTFPSLRGKAFSAYLRAGFTYVSADITANAPADGVKNGYHQTDSTSDMLGNLGFGVSYNIYSHGRLGVYLQAEGEGFGGTRSQDSKETLVGTSGSPKTATIDNTLYGGVGRVTARLSYGFGRSGLFKVFLDGGFQGQFSEINYPGVGSETENLWGPYVKIGARYSF